MPPTTFTERAMARGIDTSKVFIVFLTKEYMTKANGNGPRGERDNCHLEFKYAVMKKTPDDMLVVVLEDEMADERRWTETFAMHMGKKIYIKMCDINDHGAMDLLCETIQQLIQNQASRTGN